jgi:hypothetical protein
MAQQHSQQQQHGGGTTTQEVTRWVRRQKEVSINEKQRRDYDLYQTRRTVGTRQTSSSHDIDWGDVISSGTSTHELDWASVTNLDDGGGISWDEVIQTNHEPQQQREQDVPQSLLVVGYDHNNNSTQLATVQNTPTPESIAIANDLLRSMTAANGRFYHSVFKPEALARAKDAMDEELRRQKKNRPRGHDGPPTTREIMLTAAFGMGTMLSNNSVNILATNAVTMAVTSCIQMAGYSASPELVAGFANILGPMFGSMVNTGFGLAKRVAVNRLDDDTVANFNLSKETTKALGLDKTAPITVEEVKSKAKEGFAKGVANGLMNVGTTQALKGVIGESASNVYAAGAIQMAGAAAGHLVTSSSKFEKHVLDRVDTYGRERRQQTRQQRLESEAEMAQKIKRMQANMKLQNSEKMTLEMMRTKRGHARVKMFAYSMATAAIIAQARFGPSFLGRMVGPNIAAQAVAKAIGTAVSQAMLKQAVSLALAEAPTVFRTMGLPESDSTEDIEKAKAFWVNRLTATYFHKIVADKMTTDHEEIEAAKQKAIDDSRGWTYNAAVRGLDVVKNVGVSAISYGVLTGDYTNVISLVNDTSDGMNFLYNHATEAVTAGNASVGGLMKYMNENDIELTPDTKLDLDQPDPQLELDKATKTLLEQLPEIDKGKQQFSYDDPEKEMTMIEEQETGAGLSFEHAMGEQTAQVSRLESIRKTTEMKQIANDTLNMLAAQGQKLTNEQAFALELEIFDTYLQTQHAIGKVDPVAIANHALHNNQRFQQFQQQRLQQTWNALQQGAVKDALSRKNMAGDYRVNADHINHDSLDTYNESWAGWLGAAVPSVFVPSGISLATTGGLASAGVGGALKTTVTESSTQVLTQVGKKWTTDLTGRLVGEAINKMVTETTTTLGTEFVKATATQVGKAGLAAVGSAAIADKVIDTVIEASGTNRLSRQLDLGGFTNAGYVNRLQAAGVDQADINLLLEGVGGLTGGGGESIGRVLQHSLSTIGDTAGATTVSELGHVLDSGQHSGFDFTGMNKIAFEANLQTGAITGNRLSDIVDVATVFDEAMDTSRSILTTGEKLQTATDLAQGVFGHNLKRSFLGLAGANPEVLSRARVAAEAAAGETAVAGVVNGAAAAASWWG